MRFALVLSLLVPAALAMSSQAEARRSSPQVRSAAYTRPAHTASKANHARARRHVVQTRRAAVSPAS